MANDELTLGADFPAASRADWLTLVDKVLDGAPFDRKLVTTTYDGLGRTETQTTEAREALTSTVEYDYDDAQRAEIGRAHV